MKVKIKRKRILCALISLTLFSIPQNFKTAEAENGFIISTKENKELKVLNPMTKVKVNTILDKDDRTLVLVNELIKTEVTDIKELKATKDKKHHVHKKAYDPLVNFLTEAYKGGIPTRINSTYRTLKDQEKIYAEMEDKEYANKPAFSEHHTGLAIDLSVLVDNTEKGYKLLDDIAYKHGFILRYPKGKEDITLAPYEMWHFRFVGRVHSSFIKEKNLAFEEYLELLKKNGTTEVEVEEKTYLVIYEVPKDGEILIPLKDYEISSDNQGGYIITVEKDKE